MQCPLHLLSLSHSKRIDQGGCGNPPSQAGRRRVSIFWTLNSNFWTLTRGFISKSRWGDAKCSWGGASGRWGDASGSWGGTKCPWGDASGRWGRRVRLMGRCVVSHFVTPQHAVMAPQQPDGGPQERREGFPGRQKVPYGGGMSPQKPGGRVFCLSAPPQRPGELALGCGALSSQVLSEFSRRAVPSSRLRPSA